MQNNKQISFFSILGSVGVILHVLPIIFAISIFIPIIYKEYFAILPIVVLTLSSLLLAQILYHVFSRPLKITLQGSMITAAISWFICSVFGAFLYYLVAKNMKMIEIDNSTTNVFTHFINSLFESVSGFTSTGLTMAPKPSLLPHIMQWFRSFQAWIGGMGLVVFIISLIEPKKEEYTLYFGEARQEHVGNNIRNTVQKIWIIYFVFTVILSLLFLVEMNIWDAINHAMSSIATGGFSTNDKNLGGFSKYCEIITIVGMILGAMSFSVHYQVIIKRKFKILFQSFQHVLLFTFLIVGSVIIFLIVSLSRNHLTIFNPIFQWISSVTTSGFSTVDTMSFSAGIKMLFILAMIMGGASGSTAGGLKLRRVKNLFLAILLKFKALDTKREKAIVKDISDVETSKKEVSDINLPKTEKSSTLYSASVIFLLWMVVIFIGTFLIIISFKKPPTLHILFDVVSAMSNVGLSCDVIEPGLNSFSKMIFIFLMWIGRLEIIPVILIFAFPFMKRTFSSK